MPLSTLLMDYAIPSAALITAFIIGGRPERFAAGVAVVASILSAVLAVNTWQSLELQSFSIDLAALFGFWFVAITSNRFWPYWVTGCQIVTVLVHLQAVVTVPLHWAYGMLSIYLSIPIVLIIGGASVLRHSRQRRIRKVA